MTPDTYAVRDSTGRPVAFYDSRELAQYDTERYPGGTVVGLVGVDRLGDERPVRIAHRAILEEDGIYEWNKDHEWARDADRSARAVLAALRAELEES